MNSLSVSVIPFINTFKTCLLNVVIKGWQIQICIDFIWINLMLNSSSKIVKYYSQLCFDQLLKLYKQKLSFPVDRKLFTSCQYQYPLAGQLPLPLWPMVSKLSTSYRSIIQKKINLDQHHPVWVCMYSFSHINKQLPCHYLKNRIF